MNRDSKCVLDYIDAKRMTNHRTGDESISIESSQLHSIKINAQWRLLQRRNDFFVCTHASRDYANYISIEIRRIFKSSFLCSLFTSCSFHFFVHTVQLCEETRTVMSLNLSIPRFHGIREGNLEFKLKLKGESCKMKNGT